MTETDSDTSDDDVVVTLPDTPKKKRKKRLQRFKAEYTKLHSWATKVQGNVHQAFCTICRCNVGVGHGGANDLKVHESSAKHVKAVKENKTNKLLTQFFPSATSSNEAQVTAKILTAETVSAYHCCKHSLSYNSQDCANKLYSTQFGDSEIAKKFSSGRTKMEAIIKGVLAPESVRATIETLKDGKLPFSIASDASNMKNRKMFPLLIQYFSVKEGVQSRLLDFYEDAKEDASAITTALRNRLDKLGLPLSSVSSYSADNANVNYGRHHSVYQLLKDHAPNIVKANCCAHMVHNTLKHALEQVYTVDVETIVIRTFNHFSSSAKRLEELKSFYEFVDIEWTNLLRHVPTR